MVWRKNKIPLPLSVSPQTTPINRLWRHRQRQETSYKKEKVVKIEIQIPKPDSRLIIRFFYKKYHILNHNTTNSIMLFIDV
jgi:hypothetical protein